MTAIRRPRLGPQQLSLLCFLGSPSRALIVPDRVSNSLVQIGLLRDAHPTKSGMQRVTPAGLRRLADEMEAGRLEQFMELPVKEGV